jgi:hypothetical protein
MLGHFPAWHRPCSYFVNFKTNILWAEISITQSSGRGSGPIHPLLICISLVAGAISPSGCVTVLTHYFVPQYLAWSMPTLIACANTMKSVVIAPNAFCLGNRGNLIRVSGKLQESHLK